MCCVVYLILGLRSLGFFFLFSFFLFFLSFGPHISRLLCLDRPLGAASSLWLLSHLWYHYFLGFHAFSMEYKPSNYQPPACGCSAGVPPALFFLKLSLLLLLPVLLKPTKLVKTTRQSFSIRVFAPRCSLWCSGSVTG